MNEGSLYDRELAALAIKQAARRPDRGDLPAARLPRDAAALRRERADRYRGDGGAPAHLGGVQGPAGRPDPRADLRLHAPAARPEPQGAPRPVGRACASRGSRNVDAARHRTAWAATTSSSNRLPTPARRPAISPTIRSSSRPTAISRLQNLARGDEGFLLALGYSTQRGVTAATIRSPARSAWARSGGRVRAAGAGLRRAARPHHRLRMPDDQPVPRHRDRSAGASHAAMASPSATASARRCRWRWWTAALRARELDEEAMAPAQDEEFVLSHSDNVQATGFVEHLKLPHYVDFQCRARPGCASCAGGPAEADAPSAEKEAAE